MTTVISALDLMPLQTTKFKCSNGFCPYGPDWEAGREDRFAGELHPEQFRADAYSQSPEYRINGQAPYYGLCLNCIADQDRDRELCY